MDLNMEDQLRVILNLNVQSTYIYLIKALLRTFSNQA